MVRVIRAHDGVDVPLDGGLSQANTLELLHDFLSEKSSIPLHALIVMHPTGRQVDRATIHSLVDHDSNATNTQETIYLFDKELLEPGASLDYLDADSCEQEKKDLLIDVGHNPDAHLQASLEMIENIRNQRGALSAALLNLERHRGDQGAVKAYFHFASPLLTSYKSLLDVYPSAISLVAKIPVNNKLERSSSGSSNPARSRDKVLSDYVSKEKMGNVRDGCKRLYDDLEGKNAAITSLLQVVEEGTKQLKNEASVQDLEDLKECEDDAREAFEQMNHLSRVDFDRGSPEEREFLQLNEESEDRLRYLVERKFAETKSLLWSLQRIAELQVNVTAARDNIKSLNDDLKTRCDSFKYLGRLQRLVPSYAASLAELVRRKMFTKLLTSSSTEFAEIFSKLTIEEKKRRGLYQAEWVNILPWEIPGLDEGVLAVEVDLRGGAVGAVNGTDGKGKPSEVKPGPQITLEDLDALAKILSEIRNSLNPEDLPPTGIKHPVEDAIVVLERAREQTSNLEQEFDRLLNRLDIDGDSSEVTSVDVSGTHNHKYNPEALRLLEEKRTELERELQNERSQREQEVAQLRVRAEELMKTNEDLKREKEKSYEELENVKKESNGLTDTVEQLRKQLEVAQASLSSSSARIADLERCLKDASDHTSELRQKLDEATKETEESQGSAKNLQQQVADLTDKADKFNDKQRDLLAALGEKERLLADKERILRDHRSEAELDRATLEKELTEEKERSAAQYLQIQGSLSGKESEIAALEKDLGHKEDEYAELQVMCNERGKAIRTAQIEAEATSRQIQQLLHGFKTFYDTYTSALLGVLNEPIHVAATKNAPATDGVVTDHELPGIDFDSLDGALATFSSLDTALLGLSKDKMLLGLAQAKIWQKECKKYKERANRANLAASEKIAFRSFAKGDLALFLPTRNSAVQVFAAFNSSRPHYFLAPTGIIAEQIKEREWIVARITNITEAIVDVNVPTSNPYSLPNGSKYFRVEAEPWRKTVAGPAAAKQGGRGGNDSKGTPVQQRRASTSDIPSSSLEVTSSANANQDKEGDSSSPPLASEEPAEKEEGETGQSLSVPNSISASAFTVVDTGESSTTRSTARPMMTKSPSAPLPGTSSLSAQRPAVLEPVVEQLPNDDALPESDAANFTSQAFNPGPQINDTSLVSTSVGSTAAAFLPMSSSRPLQGSSGRGKGLSTSVPRSVSSTTDSNSFSSSFRRGIGSGSFLGSPGSKAPATTSTFTSTVDVGDDRRWTSSSPTGAAYFRQSPAKTVGRYEGRKSLASGSRVLESGTTTATRPLLDSNGKDGNGHGHGHRRVSSATPKSGASDGSTLTDLLRSFTTGSDGV